MQAYDEKFRGIICTVRRGVNGISTHALSLVEHKGWICLKGICMLVICKKLAELCVCKMYAIPGKWADVKG